MASRKKPPETMSLFGAPPIQPEGGHIADPRTYFEADMTVKAEADDGSPVVAERKLRLVPPPASLPEEDVIVEALDDGTFQVSTLRHHGTTVAAVKYTRKQLEMMVRRGHAALEVG